MADFMGDAESPDIRAQEPFRRSLADWIEQRMQAGGPKWLGSYGISPLVQDATLPDDRYQIRTWDQSGPHRVGHIHEPALDDFQGFPVWGFAGPYMGPRQDWLRSGFRDWGDLHPDNLAEETWDPRYWHLRGGQALSPPERIVTGASDLNQFDPEHPSAVNNWDEVERILRGRHDRGMRLSRYGAAEDEAAFLRSINEDPYEQTGHLAMADFLQDQGRDQDAGFRRALPGWISEAMGRGEPQWTGTVVSSGNLLHQPGREGDDRYQIRTNRQVGSGPDGPYGYPTAWEPWSWAGDEWRPADHAWWEEAGTRIPDSPDYPGDADFWRDRRSPQSVSGRHLTRPERALTGIDNLANVDPALWPHVERLLRERWDRGVKLSRYGRTDYADVNDLRSMLTQIRSDPYDTNLQAVFADALEEADGGPVADLIRRQHGVGAHTEHGPRDNLWEDPAGNSYDGTHPYYAQLGTVGPFDVYLGHERPGDNSGGRESTGNHRWIVRAASRLGGSRDTAFNFEFPHTEAHLIPQMFPEAAKIIDPNPNHPWGLIQREQESRDFERRMDEAERQLGAGDSDDFDTGAEFDLGPDFDE
jgi:uncharacterized protein (TIGR02996 family)